MKILSILIIAACVSWGQEKPKVTPTLTDKQQIEYLQALVESTQSQLNACRAPEKVQTVINKISETCPLALVNGLLACAQPPAPPPVPFAQ